MRDFVGVLVLFWATVVSWARVIDEGIYNEYWDLPQSILLGTKVCFETIRVVNKCWN